jgi:hypothetical protein
MTIHSIPVSSLVTEGSLFDIFYRCPSREFIDSIRRQGILQPVYCVERQGGYALVAGFKRWRAACEAAVADIPAVVLPAESDPAGLLEIRLQLDAGHTHMPVMAQANLVRLAVELLEDPLDWLCKPFLRRYLPMNKDLFDKLLSLAGSGTKIRAYFMKYNAPMTAVSVLLRQSEQFRNRAAEWALRFRIRPVELEKILNNTVDCARKTGQDVIRCWDTLTSGEPSEEGGHERAVYLAGIKRRMNDMRYPYLASLRTKCTAAAEILRKECGTTVAFDPTFESGTVTVSFPVSEEAEYTEAISRLASDTARNAITLLFRHE